MKIGLFGIYPPPIGGISIHVKRLSEFLYKKNIDVTVYSKVKNNLNKSYVVAIKNKKIFYIRYLFNTKDDIIHTHTHSWKERAILVFISKIHKKKFIMTLHSLRTEWNQLNLIDKILSKYVLKYSTKIISVGIDEKNKLIRWGCSKEKITVLPAYINPIEIKEDKEKIPKEAWEFIDKSKFFISANGAVRFHNSEDLYGLDMLINLVHQFKEKGLKVNLLFALLGLHSQSKNEKEYYFKLKKRIEDLGLKEEIYIYEVNDTEFYPILKRSDLFVRPTNTDGYGVSIAEAIYYNVPSIASDVCKRPEGTILFGSRESKDLEEKILDVINNYEQHKVRVKKVQMKDYAEDVVDIYKSVLQGG